MWSHQSESSFTCVHLSRVQEPLVRFSAIKLEVLTYLLWIPTSQVLRSIQSPLSGDVRIWKNVYNAACISLFLHWRLLLVGLALSMSFLPAGDSNTLNILTHNASAEIPSNLDQASIEIISASVSLCYSSLLPWSPAYIFQWLSSRSAHHAPDSDLESVRSPPNSEAWKETLLVFCCGVSHMTTLSVISCKVDEGQIDCPAFVTCFVSVGGSSSHVIF